MESTRLLAATTWQFPLHLKTMIAPLPSRERIQPGMSMSSMVLAAIRKSSSWLQEVTLLLISSWTSNCFMPISKLKSRTRKLATRHRETQHSMVLYLKQRMLLEMLWKQSLLMVSKPDQRNIQLEQHSMYVKLHHLKDIFLTAAATVLNWSFLVIVPLLLSIQHARTRSSKEESKLPRQSSRNIRIHMNQSFQNLVLALCLISSSSQAVKQLLHWLHMKMVVPLLIGFHMEPMSSRNMLLPVMIPWSHLKWRSNRIRRPTSTTSTTIP